MEEYLKERILKLPDDELIKVAYINNEDYKDDVTKLARDEANRRGLSHEVIERITIKASEEKIVDSLIDNDEHSFFSTKRRSGKLTLLIGIPLAVMLEQFFGIGRLGAIFFGMVPIWLLLMFLESKKNKKTMTKLSDESILEIANQNSGSQDPLHEKNLALDEVKRREEG